MQHLRKNNQGAPDRTRLRRSPAGGQLVGFCWEAWRDEPGRQGTLQHVEKVKSRNDYCNNAGVQLGVHEQREFKGPANSQHVGFRENELAGPLLVLTSSRFLPMPVM